MAQRKTILFAPLNTPGHVNSSLGLADKLKELYGYRTVFLILGPFVGTTIQDHGHELIEIEEVNVHEDYEFLVDDPDYLDESEQEKLGRARKKFPGSLKWPQIIRRAKKLLKLPPLTSFEQCVEMMEKQMFGDLVENHENFAKALKSIGPDLVVIDAYYVPPCIVNLKQVPWIRLFSANPLQIVKINEGAVGPPPNMGYMLMTKTERAKLREEKPESWANIVGGWKAAWERIELALTKVADNQQKYFAAHGCPPLPPGQQAHESPYLNIYMYPKEIDYDQDDDLFHYSPRWLRCDSLVRKSVIDPSQYEMWNQKLSEAMIGKEAMIYFSLGSLASSDAKLVKRYLDIFSRDQKRMYVVSKGPNGDKIALDSANMIGGNYIPQILFLEKADLAIIHGGNNTLTECLSYGVPMIVLPVFADQFDNAQRIEDMDLGRKLDINNCTEEQLLKAIDQILMDKYLIDKIKKISFRMKARDELTRITTLVSKLTEEQNLDQEFIEQHRN